jgi:hypothetical protein
MAPILKIGIRRYSYSPVTGASETPGMRAGGDQLRTEAYAATVAHSGVATLPVALRKLRRSRCGRPGRDPGLRRRPIGTEDMAEVDDDRDAYAADTGFVGDAVELVVVAVDQDDPAAPVLWVAVLGVFEQAGGHDGDAVLDGGVPYRKTIGARQVPSPRFSARCLSTVSSRARWDALWLPRTSFRTGCCALAVEGTPNIPESHRVPKPAYLPKCHPLC